MSIFRGTIDCLGNAGIDRHCRDRGTRGHDFGGIRLGQVQQAADHLEFRVAEPLVALVCVGKRKELSRPLLGTGSFAWLVGACRIATEEPARAFRDAANY